LNLFEVGVSARVISASNKASSRKLVILAASLLKIRISLQQQRRPKDFCTTQLLCTVNKYTWKATSTLYKIGLLQDSGLFLHLSASTIF
jgi:hypothetical protein